MPASILVVCTGNVCRSPLVERLLQVGLRAHPDVTVVSAGTHALVGSAMTPQAQAELVAAGGDSAGFVSRQLAGPETRAADLVLAATLTHRDRILSVTPAVTRRTFTLRELAALVDGLAPDEVGATVADRVRALPGVAAARRAVVPLGGVDLDVTDPYGGSAADYRRTTEQVVAPVRTLLRVLGADADAVGLPT